MRAVNQYDAVAVNEAVAHIFIPDAAPWLEPLPRPSPERALLEAVLNDAIACYLGRGYVEVTGPHLQTLARTRQQHREQRWVASRSTGLMSFEWVCAMLGYEPEALRSGLQRLVATGAPVTSWRIRRPSRRVQRMTHRPVRRAAVAGRA